MPPFDDYKEPRADKRPPVVVLSIVMVVVIGAGVYTLRQTAPTSREPGLRRPIRLLPQPTPPSGGATIASAASQDGATLMAATISRSLGSMSDDLRSMVTRRVLNTLQMDAGLGLWIKVDDGTGLVSRPLKRGHNLVTVGPYSAEVNTTSRDATDAALIVENWQWAPGVTNPPYLPVAAWKYKMPQGTPQGGFTMQTGGGNQEPEVTGTDLIFVPTNLDHRYQISIQPISESGQPSGLPISVRPQAAGKQLLFATLPASYSSSTTSLRVTMSGASDKPATWTITDLPKPQRLIPSNAAVEDVVTVGPFKVSGTSRLMAGGRASANVINFDAHPATDQPSVECDLTVARNGADTGDWSLSARNMVSDWSPPAVTDGNDDRPQYTPPPVLITPPAGAAATKRLSIAGSFPGQQHLVRASIEAVQTKETSEDVTLRGAKLLFDQSVGRWVVHWDRLETVTTRSGVIVTALNVRPPVGSQSESLPADIWTNLKAAGLYIGVRLPPSQTADTSAYGQRQVKLAATGNLTTAFAISPSGGWRAVWIPGELPPGPLGFRRRGPFDSPTYHLAQSGFEPWLLSIASPLNATAKPSSDSPDSPPFTIKDGAITVRITTRMVVKRLPVILTIPIAKQS
ncbi:MAG TPA: hypothetical protein VGK19_10110 [Capsulimonadaceae bacterium]|jgi:hypothetical protein